MSLVLPVSFNGWYPFLLWQSSLSNKTPKTWCHATNAGLPPQRQNSQDIWLGNTQSEFNASPAPLCLFSLFHLSTSLSLFFKKTNCSPPSYCLFKLAWPPHSLPHSIPSTVSARGLKARLVHCFTSETLCVFVSSGSLGEWNERDRDREKEGEKNNIWSLWWMSEGTVHVFCDDGGVGDFGRHTEHDTLTHTFTDQ